MTQLHGMSGLAGRMKVTGVAFALVLTAAACSDSSDDASSTTTAAPAAVTTTTVLQPTGAGCGQVPTSGEGSVKGMADDTVGTAASNNPLLTTLVTAVKKANLVDTLNAPGPYTVFAPVNDAFAKVPSGDLNALLANDAELKKVLTYHVVPGKMTSADFTDGMKLTTAAGPELTVSKSGETIKVNGKSTVVCADVPTANATVFLIDTVLMPPKA